MPPNHDNAGGGKAAIQVHFEHLGEREKANFKVAPADTLQAIWDLAYDELDVAKDQRDILQAPRPGSNPVSLMDHLALSLANAQTQGLCDTHFEIAARTGGA